MGSSASCRGSVLGGFEEVDRIPKIDKKLPGKLKVFRAPIAYTKSVKSDSRSINL